ncbi:hypothetical protein CHS0354_021929 [Potamilus streckersoni]|uniref:Uncharacterized protein n=1 Tax=Potamilus streckersoni TaxID=2493646 RepID=A0AAE0SJW3_9BIVA|nr:hypothetical protein CHS0354_021929 [Potamilus streckersoni]
MEYHQKLRMGCCITGGKCGTLGGFVDLPDGKIGCLTAAHVVLDQNQFHRYIKLGEERKRQLSLDFEQGKKEIHIYQPTPEPGLIPFGRVQAVALDAGNIFSPSVDAAIIQITDEERKPQMEHFPDGNFENVGFTKEDPMLYTSGRILNDVDLHQKGCLVIKFGCTTGIARGSMEWIGESVRPVDISGSYSFPFMIGQLEVKSYNFSAEGDSGALVFLCLGGNIQNLHAVGMIIGGSSTGCQCFITPIKAVFEKLGLVSNRFKVFPYRQLSQQETIPEPLREQFEVTEHLTMVEQNMNRSMNESLIRIEQNMNENMNRRFMTVEQNIFENMNERFMRVEQNMNERLTRAEQNMNENMNLVLTKWKIY